MLLFTSFVIGSILLPLHRPPVWFGLGLIMLAGSYTSLLQAPQPGHIILGLFLGHNLVIMSLCIVRLSLQPVQWTLRLIPDLLATYATRVDVVIRYLLVAIYEECLWRGTIQSRLGTSPGAIILTSVLFTLAHLNKRRTVCLAELIDLFLFSAILGCLFAGFNALYLVILVHLIRNVDLSYLGRVVAHPAVEASPD
jgi:membrane protease YdiL (CAAX protease family)